MKKPYRTTSCFRDPMESGIDPEKPQPAKDLATIEQEKQKQKITSRISSRESRISIGVQNVLTSMKGSSDSQLTVGDVQLDPC